MTPGTAATAYDGAKAAYEATEGMTQANLDALSNAATAAKEKADAALALAAGGSAAQLSEAQAAVVAADMADTHASGITMALESGIATALTAYDTAKTAHAAAKTAHDDDASLDNANALKTAADNLLAAAKTAQEKGAWRDCRAANGTGECFGHGCRAICCSGRCCCDDGADGPLTQRRMWRRRPLKQRRLWRRPRKRLPRRRP